MKTKKPTILVLNGPNLNLLGKRKVNIYGPLTLEQIIKDLRIAADEFGYAIDPFHSNSEGDLITRIQESPKNKIAGIILNPGGLTHTSVSLRDAVEYAQEWGVPTVEVHLSDIEKREEFRRFSYLSAHPRVVIGQVKGVKALGYFHGLQMLVEYLKK